MKAPGSLSLDLTQLDDCIQSFRHRLEQPVNDKIREYETRREEMIGLLNVAELLKETEVIDALGFKILEVEECISSLRNIWQDQSHPPTAPPAVSVEQDEVVMAPEGEQPPEPQVIEGSTEEAPTEEEPTVEERPERTEAERIAEEALRDSRRRGYVGSNAMKATPGPAPARSYQVIPANSAAANQLGFNALKNTPGLR